MKVEERGKHPAPVVARDESGSGKSHVMTISTTMVVPRYQGRYLISIVLYIALLVSYVVYDTLWMPPSTHASSSPASFSEDWYVQFPHQSQKIR